MKASNKDSLQKISWPPMTLTETDIAYFGDGVHPQSASAVALGKAISQGDLCPVDLTD